MSWEDREQNEASTAHLLTSAELRRRGLTRYDAKMILASGQPLPDPPTPLSSRSSLSQNSAFSSSQSASQKSQSSCSSIDFSQGSCSSQSVVCVKLEKGKRKKPVPVSACRRSPRKRPGGSIDSSAFVKVKQECLSENDEDEYLDVADFIKKEPDPPPDEESTEDLFDDADQEDDNEDEELRRHNLSDFLDSSPRLNKEHQKHPDQNHNPAPPLSPPVVQPPSLSPLKSSTPIRQSPRLHAATLQSIAESQQRLSRRQRHSAVRELKELTSLLTDASNCSARLTEILMEGSQGEPTQYQDPPVLEPEPPIISPAVSPPQDETDRFGNENNIFTNILRAGGLSPVERRARSVDETSFSANSTSLNHLTKVSEEHDIFSHSDGFKHRYRRRSSEERPPLLKKNSCVKLEAVHSHESESLPQHLHVGEGVYLRSPAARQSQSQGQSDGQPALQHKRIILKLKRDPELKRQLRAERRRSGASTRLMFKWDGDDSDGETDSFTAKTCEQDGSEMSCSPRTSLSPKEQSNTADRLSAQDSGKGRGKGQRKVKKVKLKLIDTPSLHFDLVSPWASPNQHS